MKFKWLLISIWFLLLPNFCYAFFCPTNFNLVQIGDSLDHVLQQCGKPDKRIDETKKPEGPQEWTFYTPQEVTTPSLYSTTGSLKTQMTFDNSGKIINISVNGIGVGATTICGGYNVQLGDDREQVKRACGEPSFINRDANPKILPEGSNKDLKITTIIYNGGPATPGMKLTFVNGVLSSQE